MNALAPLSRRLVPLSVSPYALLFCLGLMGCQHSAPTRYFALNAVPPQGAPVSIQSSIRIEAVHVPPGMDRPDFVRDGGDHQLEIDEFNRWNAPLANLLTQTLSEDLISRLSPGAVVFPDSPSVAGTRSVIIDILTLRTNREIEAMTASFTILPLDASGQSIRRQVTVSVPAPSPRPGDQARALSDLAAQLADRIAASLAQGAVNG